MSFADKRFLIVAGQPKAGTTSVFDWMAQHPDICGSRTKETRFFLDADYPLPRSFGFDGSNLEDYAKLFEAPDRKVLLEATPDYMFSPAFLQVADLLPNARIVVLLRDPVDRVTSAYHFYCQRGLVPKGWSLPDYVSAMAETQLTPDTPVHLRVLEQCRGYYLERMKEAFGDRLLVLNFADLRARPQEVLDQLSAFADLPPMPEITFDNRNKSRGVRFHGLARGFYWLKPRVVYALQRFGLDRLIPLFRSFNKAAERLISKELDKSGPDDTARDLITAYLERPV